MNSPAQKAFPTKIPLKSKSEIKNNPISKNTEEIPGLEKALKNELSEVVKEHSNLPNDNTPILQHGTHKGLTLGTAIVNVVKDHKKSASVTINNTNLRLNEEIGIYSSRIEELHAKKKILIDSMEDAKDTYSKDIENKIQDQVTIITSSQNQIESLNKQRDEKLKQIDESVSNSLSEIQNEIDGLAVLISANRQATAILNKNNKDQKKD